MHRLLVLVPLAGLFVGGCSDSCASRGEPCESAEDCCNPDHVCLPPGAGDGDRVCGPPSYLGREDGGLVARDAAAPRDAGHGSDGSFGGLDAAEPIHDASFPDDATLPEDAGSCSVAGQSCEGDEDCCPGMNLGCAFGAEGMFCTEF